MQPTAKVLCPYCAQENVVAIDWGGAAHQEYEEDCQVCCRPWRVCVLLGTEGSVDVTLDRLED